MALPIYRYPLDKTGENPDNYVGDEPHSLTPQIQPTDVRVACPLYGPFFSESIRIMDRSNGRILIKGDDYKITDLLQDPTLSFGKEIGQFIVVTSALVSNEIAISYQVLGGNYQNDATAVQHVYQTFLNDTRPVDWRDISGKPSTYPPSAHIHLLDDVVGWGPVIVALDNVRDAILLNNTPMYEALIDWVNKRIAESGGSGSVSWNSITNKPNSLQGYNIRDAVDLINNQTINGVKTFKYAKLLKQSTAENINNANFSQIVTIDYLDSVKQEIIDSLNRAGSLKQFFYSQI